MKGGPGAFGNVPESPADAAGKVCVPVFLGEMTVKDTRRYEGWSLVAFLNQSTYILTRIWRMVLHYSFAL